MYTPSLKPILIGIVIGIVLFAMPFFLLKALFFVLLIGGMIRFFKRYNFYHRQQQGLHPAFTDTIRQMNEEEYQSFRQTLAGVSHYHHHIPVRDVE